MTEARLTNGYRKTMDRVDQSIGSEDKHESTLVKSGSRSDILNAPAGI